MLGVLGGPEEAGFSGSDKERTRMGQGFSGLGIPG